MSSKRRKELWESARARARERGREGERERGKERENGQERERKRARARARREIDAPTNGAVCSHVCGSDACVSKMYSIIRKVERIGPVALTKADKSRQKQQPSTNSISICAVHYAPTSGAVCCSCMCCIHVWHVSWCGNNHQASSIVRSLLEQSPILVGLFYKRDLAI